MEVEKGFDMGASWTEEGLKRGSCRQPGVRGDE